MPAPDDGTVVTEQPVPPHAPERTPDPAARALLRAAVRRARLTIFWDRLWPALAALSTAVGLFLSLSWLGLWLWLPPLGRTGLLIVFAVVAVAAIMPFVLLRIPGLADGLRRLDRGSGVRHRAATAIADELAGTTKDRYSLALWNAHGERSLRAGGGPKSG